MTFRTALGDAERKSRCLNQWTASAGPRISAPTLDSILKFMNRQHARKNRPNDETNWQAWTQRERNKRAQKPTIKRYVELEQREKSWGGDRRTRLFDF